MLLIGVRGGRRLAAVLASGAEGGGGPTGSYLVRAYFDNAGFLVKDEEVRVAGATVGTVDSVDVTMPGEAVYRERQGRAGQGRRRPQHHRPRLPGLAHGRELHHPPAVAAR